MINQRALNSIFHRSKNPSPFEIMFSIKMKNNSSTGIIDITKNDLIDDCDNSRQQMKYESKLQIQKVQDTSIREILIEKERKIVGASR